MSAPGQSRHFDRAPLASGLRRIADILRIGRSHPGRAAEVAMEARRQEGHGADLSLRRQRHRPHS